MSETTGASTARAFDSLALSDLHVDQVYPGGTSGNVSDDPIARLLPVGNSGGIRYRGPRTAPSVIALLTSGEDLDWPDRLDAETGVLVYYGDNKNEGRDLHDTPRGGNVVLRNVFDWAHGGVGGRQHVPPIFVFSRVGRARDYRFLGLAVPGSSETSFSDDLIGIWRSNAGLRYQNYQASFTILDVSTISRAWIEDVLHDGGLTANAPGAWLSWQEGAPPRALLAPRTSDHRTRSEQEPTSPVDVAVVGAVYKHFAERPFDFEHFAADLVRMHLPAVTSLDVTRRSRDGGRDAIGLYRVGSGPGSILLDFSMEAKCYQPGNGVGVRELSRLISRLRHRQFGVLVTTSHLDSQAYRELKEDGHPIVVVAGREIAEIVRSSRGPGLSDLHSWLQSSYPG
jgi:hypothetical protein